MDTADRKVAMMVYGFPPNVGAVETAALLDVGESIRLLLIKMKEEGYYLGECNPENWKGDDIVAALRTMNAESSGEGGFKEARRILLGNNRQRALSLPGVELYGREISPKELKQWLGNYMSSKMETQWGDLENYRNPGNNNL